MIVTSATWKQEVVRRVKSCELLVSLQCYLSASRVQMPRFGRRATRQRVQRRDSPTTWLATSHVSGHGRSRDRPATLPTPPTGVPEGTSASLGRGSRHSATSLRPPTVVLTGSHSDQPDRELPHDLEQLLSVIRAEIQQALATAVSRMANTPTSTQLAPLSSVASAA